MGTYSIKPKDITRKWYILDASEVPIGRLSTIAASLLIGKGKPSFSSHIDAGDYVVVINAGSLVATGNKQSDKVYFRHSGFPGGIKQKRLNDSDPEDVIRHSIRGMLPVNKLRKGRLERLNVYLDSEHKHAAQNPEKYTLKRSINNGR